MPEGPSIILVKEAVAKFTGEKIIAHSGNSKIDQSVSLPDCLFPPIISLVHLHSEQK